MKKSLPLSEPNRQSLINDYRQRLAQRVGTLRIFGESDARPLEKVFVELHIIAEYRHPSIHSEYLGLMDFEMRRRRMIFSPSNEGFGGFGQSDRSSKRTIASDELLGERTQALVTGAPGSGKTTLLRYLAHRINSDATDNRLPVFLELKTVAAEDFHHAQNNLAELLLARAVIGSAQLEAAEREALREAFFAKLKAGEAAIFLDGLDEIRGVDVTAVLRPAVNEFNANYRGNLLIVSTRPYAMEPFDGLREMEIAPLNQTQIEQLLRHYYPDEQTESLLALLRGRADLRDITQVPFLLNVIIGLHRKGEAISGNRLEPVLKLG